MIHKTKNLGHKIFLLLLAVAMLLSSFINPEFYEGILSETDFSSITQIMLYLPAFFILVAISEVWLPEKFVIGHLGKQSGVLGTFYSFLLGSLLPGPLYLAFPIAAALLRKGVTRFNISIFLGAWAAFKLVEEVFELQFLGLRFLLLRVFVSLPSVIIISFIIDRFHVGAKRKNRSQL